ncbi:hypothetical protein LP420_39775 [Massilia sp. B-10]|nr:hypothetical protein LP420_39775 [Massilia sp. B-10]
MLSHVTMMAASGQVNVIERAVLIADMISGLLEPVASTVSQDFQSYTYRWVPHEHDHAHAFRRRQLHCTRIW